MRPVPALSSSSDWVSRTDVRDRLDDDLGDLVGYLVRQEEHRARDGHQVCVRARLEGAALIVGEPAVALLGVDDPGRHARMAQPLSRMFVPMQPPQVLAQTAAHVTWHVLAEVVA